jgi:hypothetical protein
MRGVNLACLFAVALVAFSGRPSAQEKDPVASARVPPEEIEKLVKQLGSNDARTRETATKAIQKIGDDALPHLEVAMTSN